MSEKAVIIILDIDKQRIEGATYSKGHVLLGGQCAADDAGTRMLSRGGPSSYTIVVTPDRRKLAGQ